MCVRERERERERERMNVILKKKCILTKENESKFYKVGVCFI